MLNKDDIIVFKTILGKEVFRFLKVWGQTLLGPLITTSLFLFVFSIAIGTTSRFDGLSYTYQQFLIPGLLMMTVIQNSFANTSSSLIIAKINGNIVDIFTVPVNNHMILLAYFIGAVIRGLLVSVALLAFVRIFISFSIDHIFLAIYFIISASWLMGTLGFVAGILCSKFDQLSNFTNIFITPLSFLSGTFFTIEKFPEWVQSLLIYNPFFHMINGLRYAFIGYEDFNYYIASIILLSLNVALYAVAYLMWSSGYKIKQ